MCYQTPIINLNILSALTTLEISILVVLGIVTIIAFLAFRVNYRTQMGVSAYIDTESEVYNEKGLEIYLSKNKKRVSNPTLVVVHIKNLGLLYNEYPKKEKLMMTIADTLLKGLTKRETVARIEFDKFAILYEDKSKEEVKNLCFSLKDKLNDLNFDSYGKYNFVVLFGVYENAPLKEPKKTIILTSMVPQYSTIYDKNIYYYCEDVNLAVQKLYKMNELKNAALEEGRFVPYIQPKVSFKTGKVIGGEILTRWVDQNHNPIFFPTDFIPLFESNGFIKEIDMLMLKNACMFTQTLVNRGYNDIIISVNVSKINFISNNFVQTVLNTISNYNISPRNIEIEITESAIIDNSQIISNAIMQLRQAGLRISMDDFGKDNSSLGSLSTNPFDTVKIDGVFFKDRLSTEKNKTIIENILNMLEKLHYEIVCECVEDKQTLDVLATINQDFIIQGNYISKPIPLNLFENFVDTKFEFNYPPLFKEEVKEIIVEKEVPANGNPNQQTIIYQNAFELDDLKQQIRDMQKTIEDQKMQAYEQEIKFMREQMEMMRNFQLNSMNNNGNNQQAPQQDPKKDFEIELLKKEIESLKTQNAAAQQQSQGIDVEELILRLSQTQNEKIQLEIEKMNQETQNLRETLERERKEREELERLLYDIRTGEEEMKNELENENEYNQDYDPNAAVYDEIDDDDDDDDDDEDNDEDALDAPKFSLKELEAIIEDYKAKYQEEWNKKAKEELKDGYYEVINGLKYYRGRIKLKFSDKLKNASDELKATYNAIKNEILQYDNVVNKTLKSYDAFYIGRKQIAKLSLTKTKVRAFLAVDSANYPERQFPHRDVSHKKAHAKTPFLMMIKSNLSVRRLSKIIADIMTENDCTINQSYEKKDYIEQMQKESK